MYCISVAFLRAGSRFGRPWLCLAFALALAPVPARAATNAAPRPNIVFILADDLGWGETGCYGQEKIRTPNIDALAKQGMRFTRAYSGAPVCAPSRCVLMTGLNLSKAPIRGNKARSPEGQFPLAASYETWVQRLQAGAGYATRGIGKWGLGMPDNDGSPMRHGFLHFYGYMCQAQAHSYYPSHLWDNDRRVELNNGPNGVPGHGRGTNFARFTGSDYAPDRFMAEAMKWLDARAGSREPFLLYLPLTEPHVALQPPARITASYPREWDAAPYLGEKGYCPTERPRAAYAALITSLDEHVGEVLRRMERLGMVSNTVVIFTSDNGATHDVGGVDTAFFKSVGGLRGRKGSLYEGGVRVPFIVRWPGRAPAGSVSDEIVAFADILPTLCDIAGAPAPRCDGVSLLPLFEGKRPAAPHPPIVSDFPEYGGQQSVIDGKWKIIRTGLVKAGRSTPPPWQLYDLEADRNETTNLARKHPDEVRRLEAVFEANYTPNADFPMYPAGK